MTDAEWARPIVFIHFGILCMVIGTPMLGDGLAVDILFHALVYLAGLTAWPTYVITSKNPPR